MSFYGLIISITILICILQINILVSESQSINAITTAYYLIIHTFSNSMTASSS